MKELYVVTKHYNEKTFHGFGPFKERADAETVLEKRSHHKGKFKGKAVVRVWKLIKETEVK